jgi:hypothetical protein
MKNNDLWYGCHSCPFFVTCIAFDIDVNEPEILTNNDL